MKMGAVGGSVVGGRWWAFSEEATQPPIAQPLAFGRFVACPRNPPGGFPRGSHDEGHAGESQVAVRRPTGGDAALGHQCQAVGIGKSEALIAEFLEKAGCFDQLLGVERLDRERREGIDEVEELDCADLIVAAQKPAVSLGDYQRRSHERAWIGKQAFEQRMITIGAVEERDKSGDDWTFAPETAFFTVREHFKVASLDGFGLKDKTAAIGAAGAALHYLTQNLRRDVKHLTRISFHRRNRSEERRV